MSYAIYNQRARKMRGGFSTELEAWIWLGDNVGFELYDADGELVVECATVYEASLHLKEDYVMLPIPPTNFDVLPEA